MEPAQQQQRTIDEFLSVANNEFMGFTGGNYANEFPQQSQSYERGDSFPAQPKPYECGESCPLTDSMTTLCPTPPPTPEFKQPEVSPLK